MERRNDPIACEECGQNMTKLFTTNFQLNTRPEAYSDDNKFALGLSDRERLDTMKADDKAYEKSWEPKDGTRAETGVKRTTVKQALEKMPLNSIFPHQT